MYQRLFSLTGMMMRSDAALEVYDVHAAQIAASSPSDDQLLEEAKTQLPRVENSTFTRCTSLLMIHLALLYTVIEGWRKWGFVDDAVDQLLNRTEFVEELKGFRHAMFHAIEFDDERVLQFQASEERTQWLTMLSDSIRRALRDLHANTPQRFIEHLQRKKLI